MQAPSNQIVIEEAGLHLVIEISQEGDVRLLHCAPVPPDDQLLPPAEKRPVFRLVEVQLTGEDRDAHHDAKHLGSMPGNRLKYVAHSVERNKDGRRLTLQQRDPLTGLEVTSYFQFYAGLPLVRAWTALLNAGEKPLGVEYVSSFALTGLVKEASQPWEDTAVLHVPHNTWCEELQWRTYNLPQLGLTQLTRSPDWQMASMKRLSYQSVGSWSTSQFLPMGLLENTESNNALLWQIESSGGWHWELSDVRDQLYLRLSGPTDQEHQWWKELGPGESFESVPVAVAVARRASAGQFSAPEQAIQTLTEYRRRLRRPNPDNERLPVIFNDYMNALNADPTTDKELPYIKAAAEAGCEVYCIDAGWYAERDRSWWDTVGEWQPTASRFPDGLPALLNHIRDQSMIPGLWLELEVVGVNSPLVAKVPEDWFFQRHGKRVIDHGRYQLDYRNSEVRAYADGVIDRLVTEYGVGYIKMDYNINAGVGTDHLSDSSGDGLLEHSRAYLDWLEQVFARYPELVIENCSSGGMRMDYALLARHSIQSTSDQTDYRRAALIAAAAPSGVTPEQAAVWAYPLADAAPEAVVTNMVNALFGRIHLSGQLVGQNEAGVALIKEAINLYKTTLRQDIRQGVPVWPLGWPRIDSPWTSLGLICPGEGQSQTLYLAVWRYNGETADFVVPLPQLAAKVGRVELVYPQKAQQVADWWSWDNASGDLNIRLDEPYTARLFRLTFNPDLPN